VIYYDLVADTQIWFVNRVRQGRGEASDLSAADEKRALEGVIEERRSHATITAHAGRSPAVTAAMLPRHGWRDESRALPADL
jgi:hypothetical protein